MQQRRTRTTIRIRAARRSDREPVLEFCRGTFSWGDYIERVWDMWLADAAGRGRLLVAEQPGEKRRRVVAMSHVAICPGGRSAWLEGVRVHPDFRRSGVASALVKSMLAYAGRRGAGQASAIVAEDNAPSQRMMERNGFAAISRWAYYSIAEGKKPDVAGKQKKKAWLAGSGDLDPAWQYLQSSHVYRESAAGRYVKAWQWYPLDRKTLRALVRQKRVVLAAGSTASTIEGLMVINGAGYWDRKDVLQVVYLDSQQESAVAGLLSFAARLYSKGRFSRLHVICPRDGHMAPAVERMFEVEESEQFLLYNNSSKDFTA